MLLKVENNVDNIKALFINALAINHPYDHIETSLVLSSKNV